MHALTLPRRDGFVVEMLDVANPPSDAPPGFVLGGGGFEPAVRDSEASVKFYNELLGFDFKLGASFNDNQDMASTAGAPGASFRQSRALIPGTSMPMTLIEFKNIERKELAGRTQDPGTTVLQLIVKDVAALSAKLKAAGVSFVTMGSEPVQVAPGLKIVIDVNNGTSRSISLDTVVLTVADAKGTPGVPMSQSGSHALRGSLGAHKDSSGTYVFTIPAGHRDPITVNFSYSSAAPVALFVGDAK